MAEGRVLIADDEDGLRWVIEKGFRGAGYQVTAVKDGAAALAEAQYRRTSTSSCSTCGCPGHRRPTRCSSRSVSSAPTPRWSS